VSIIVSDTSPVRALAHLQLLHLLDDLYGEVFVPPAVADELEHPRPASAVVVHVAEHPFFRLQSPAEYTRVAQLRRHLDPGESEAIALAEELKADLLLIDDRRGRAHASRLGFATMGVVGVLLSAKQAGMISHVAPLLDRLRAELRFFISDVVRAEVLRRAGE
jgi:predicted nucleic acid-binding protein